jgi:hypothetical protein
MCAENGSKTYDELIDRAEGHAFEFGCAQTTTFRHESGNADNTTKWICIRALFRIH